MKCLVARFLLPHPIQMIPNDLTETLRQQVGIEPRQADLQGSPQPVPHD
jgi:hypothetical protein